MKWNKAYSACLEWATEEYELHSMGISQITGDTTDTWPADGNSHEHVNKYKVHQLHQKFEQIQGATLKCICKNNA